MSCMACLSQTTIKGETMTKKYVFTGLTKMFGSIILHQIKRLSDGLIGGWIEKEANLAQVSGNAWVSGNARVSVFSQIIVLINQQYPITITQQNCVIGCQIQTHKYWLKVTFREAIEMGLRKDQYKFLKQVLPLLFKQVMK